MATKVTLDDIQTINRLYYNLHSYAAVAREVGFSPATVKRYVNPSWKPVDESKIKRFKVEDLPQFNFMCFMGHENLGDLCELTEDEQAEVEALWEEIQ